MASAGLRQGLLDAVEVALAVGAAVQAPPVRRQARPELALHGATTSGISMKLACPGA